MGGVEGQAAGHSGYSSMFRVKMQLKSHCAQDQTEAGASGQGPSQPHLVLSSSTSSRLGIILLHHSSLHSQSANVVSWELPDTPMSPPRPLCCSSSLLRRKVFFGDCWTASKIQLNNSARKAVFPPIFQRRKLRLDAFSRPSC